MSYYDKHMEGEVATISKKSFLNKKQDGPATIKGGPFFVAVPVLKSDYCDTTT